MKSFVGYDTVTVLFLQHSLATTDKGLQLWQNNRFDPSKRLIFFLSVLRLLRLQQLRSKIYVHKFRNIVPTEHF